MKHSILLAGVLILFSLAASSQEKKPKDRLANLNLTTEQKASVDSIRKVYNAKREDVKKDSTLSNEDRAKKMSALTKEQGDFVNNLLTEEQRQQLKEQRKKKGHN